jgi:hypothetical protein
VLNVVFETPRHRKAGLFIFLPHIQEGQVVTALPFSSVPINIRKYKNGAIAGNIYQKSFAAQNRRAQLYLLVGKILNCPRTTLKLYSIFPQNTV